MNIFRKLFASNPESQDNSVNQSNSEITSKEHIEFANAAIEVFNPLMRKFGFNLLQFKITEYNTTIIWIKGKCYIDFGANTHPHDSPSYYGIALGEFKGDYYHYAEVDSVGLWRLKAIQDNLDSVEDTLFPFGADIGPSLIETKDDLLKYAKRFLENDLTQFYIAREKQWNQ